MGPGGHKEFADETVPRLEWEVEIEQVPYHGE